jgi:hypothetical protein
MTDTYIFFFENFVVYMGVGEVDNCSYIAQLQLQNIIQTV